jgi:hypothetical protein
VRVFKDIQGIQTSKLDLQMQRWRMLCWKAVGRPSGGSIIWCACFAHGDWMREHRKEITFMDINFVRALSSDICRKLAAFGKQEFDNVCGLFSGLKVTLQFSPNRIFTCKHPANSLFGKPENGHKTLSRQDQTNIELQNPPNSNGDHHVCAF